MEKQTFTNEVILSWLQYFSHGTTIDLEHVKILDVTQKNKNIIPTVESHKTTLIFTNAGLDDIFYRLWNVGLGECDVWFNEGSEPIGIIQHKKVKQMIDRGINSSAGMLIVNPNARNTSRIGLSNEKFKSGSIHYVGSEIRAIILNKMAVTPQDNICVISGESIAIEAALIAPEGSITAVEYNQADRDTLEDNIEHFGLQNVAIVDRIDNEIIKTISVPDTVFMVASASMDKELECLININPEINIVIYTLDFQVAANITNTLEPLGVTDIETIQVSVSTLGSDRMFKQTVAPWIITAKSSK